MHLTLVVVITASSRSGSPSSRLSYATYRDGGTVLDSGPTSIGSMGRPRRLGGAGGIPRSTGTSREASRETSPNRYGSMLDRSYGSKLRYVIFVSVTSFA